MENPKLKVSVGGEEKEVELLVLASTRTLADEVAIQKRMGYERYRDWTQNGEGWSAPDAMEALVWVSLERAGVDGVAEIPATAVADAILETLRGVVENPTSGE